MTPIFCYGAHLYIQYICRLLYRTWNEGIWIENTHYIDCSIGGSHQSFHCKITEIKIKDSCCYKYYILWHEPSYCWFVWWASQNIYQVIRKHYDHGILEFTHFSIGPEAWCICMRVRLKRPPFVRQLRSKGSGSGCWLVFIVGEAWFMVHFYEAPSTNTHLLYEIVQISLIHAVCMPF